MAKIASKMVCCPSHNRQKCVKMALKSSKLVQKCPKILQNDDKCPKIDPNVCKFIKNGVLQ